MFDQVSATVLALLAALATAFDLPPLPGAAEGPAALWTWLWNVNSALSIPDAQFRWMFGGFSLPIVLLFEIIGIRKDWKLYPFLLPFWLIFGSIALGVVGGLAATAAHLVLFPVGRIWFMVRDRVRAPRPATWLPGPSPGSAALPATRPTRDALRAALQAIRAGVEELRAARPVPGRPADPVGALLRALRTTLGTAAASRARPASRSLVRPPPSAPARSSEATGEPPGKPDFSPFRPDLSRFKRRPPH